MSDQPVDGEQPEQGQDASDSTGAPYREYLDRIPEEVRDQVEPVFQEWDRNTNQKFQDAAEYRKAWEPYEEAGVNQVDPGELQQLIEFRQALQDNPQGVQQWYESYAQQMGLEQQQQQQQESWDNNEFVDPSSEFDQQLQQRLQPLQEQLSEFNTWRESQEMAVREQAAAEWVRGQMTELQTKHGDEFNEQAVEKLIANYIETDPEHAVQRAFSDWQAIRSQIEKATLSSKSQQPMGAEAGGGTDASPDRITSLKQAEAIARAQLRADNEG